jgi:hypothetical protein
MHELEVLLAEIAAEEKRLASPSRQLREKPCAVCRE